MRHKPPKDIREFLALLKQKDELCEIDVPLSPNLIIPEVHRRVIERGGPALLFNKVLGSRYKLTTNLFGTEERVRMAFGTEPIKFVEELVALVHQMPPTFGKLWNKRSSLKRLIGLGTKNTWCQPPVLQAVDSPSRLEELPLTVSWPEDGGAFVTLPLVYTQDPDTGVPNLGMYRIQRYDNQTTGLHCQIGKGGGFHLSKALEQRRTLPVTITLGGPPALILAAIAPLPENVSELMLASFVLGSKLATTKHAATPYPIFADAEAVMIGNVNPLERRPEGPFGDHYGYYSLQHDYPVFHCSHLVRREDPIIPATVVGKPRQEDYYIGNYLQRLLSPLFPLVMPSVRKLWSYGETGFHALAAAVVRERYSREACAAAMRILGEGQLALTKFLFVTDALIDVENIREVLSHVLARADFSRDLFIISNLSLDTLDYTGPKVNEGSRGFLLGLGEKRRELPTMFNRSLPGGSRNAQVFCPGCLLVDGPTFSNDRAYPQQLASCESIRDWPLVILVDRLPNKPMTDQDFLWTVFTRFEPAADIFAQSTQSVRYHHALTPPIVIDARMKPWYPGVVEPDVETVRTVDKIWSQLGL